MVLVVILVQHAQFAAIGDSVRCSASMESLTPNTISMKTNVRKFLSKWIGASKSASNDKDLRKHIFQQSMPILWFGDFEEYEKSAFKIVTVGLNPSYKEFVESRFEKTVIKDFNCKKCCALDAYYESLNKYFTNNPYTKWFGNFEKVLEIFGSSYGGNVKNGSRLRNTSVHIDICSPFATCPTWGNLCNVMQEKFKTKTNGLFVESIILLKPDLIIISCSEKIIDSVFHGSKKINAAGVLSKYIYGFNWTPSGKLHAVKVICGRNMRGTPFGGFAIGNRKEMKKLMKKLGNVK